MSDAALPAKIAEKVETPFRRFVSEFAESKVALGALVVFVIIALLAIFAPWITPQNPYDLAELDIMDGRMEPGTVGGAGFTYWLGTDELGRDFFSRLLLGGQISIVAAACAGLIAAFGGGILGLATAYHRGLFDDVVSRFVEMKLSIPSILLVSLFVTETQLPCGS